MHTTISKKELRTVILKMANEGLKGNEFDATFTQYIMETYLGIEYGCPTSPFYKIPGIISHRINETPADKKTKNIKYWLNRFWK